MPPHQDGVAEHSAARDSVIAVLDHVSDRIPHAGRHDLDPGTAQWVPTCERVRMAAGIVCG